MLSKKTQLIEEARKKLEEMLVLNEVLKTHEMSIEFLISQYQTDLEVEKDEAIKPIILTAIKNYTEIVEAAARELADNDTCIRFIKKNINDLLES